uniref:RING-type domain-containing protein n=1 Tax=Kalanchoe fedtschenkoi TaxID=63787 RepID=A0A7N0ZWB5_KALFE
MGQSLDSMGRRQSKDETVYQAAVAGDVEAIKALCREGARLEWFDQEGKTALIAASLSPALYNVAKTLIELGANVNAYRPGRNAGTPLHHAAKRGLDETVKLLLSHGANALVMNDDCQTPLDIARIKGFTNVVRLIEHHISFFTGWLREFHGPGFLGALAPQLLTKKIWVVVVPCGPVSPSKPLKLELAIYNTLQDSQPRTVISLWKSQMEEPKSSQTDQILRILDKATGHRHKLGPAHDGDKQQIQLFYNACSGIRQTIPSIVDPGSLSSASTSQNVAEDAQLAMAISASIETANEGRPPLPSNHSSVASSTNGWGDLPNEATYNGWGPSDAPSESGAGSNGWTDQPADASYSGWGALESGTSSHQTKPVPTLDSVQLISQMNNEIPGTVSINPTAPPLPLNGFAEGSIHYPSIDMSPVELPNATTGQGATGVNADGNNDGGSSCCIICWEAPVQGACIPCGHMAGCMSCLTEIKSKKGDCPVCRAKINQVIRLYAV